MTVTHEVADLEEVIGTPFPVSTRYRRDYYDDS